MDILNAQTIKQLRKTQKELLIKTTVTVKMCNWLQKTIAWCEEREIKLGCNIGADYIIKASGIESIENWLQANNQGNLTQQAKSLTSTRRDVAVYSANEKNARILPTETMVLAAFSNNILSPRHQQIYFQKNKALQTNILVDYTTINLQQFNNLIIIENFDSFNDWYQYQIPQNLLTQALVVYRGHDKYHSKGCQELKRTWKTIKGNSGQIYFGDFDIGGFAINIDSKTDYQHILLPKYDYLIKNLDLLHYNSDHSYRRRTIIDKCPQKWKFLLKLLFKKQAGMRQQRMFDMPLVLY